MSINGVKILLLLKRIFNICLRGASRTGRGGIAPDSLTRQLPTIPKGDKPEKGAVVGVMGGVGVVGAVGVVGVVGVVGAVRVVGVVGVEGKSPRILENLKKSQKCKLQTCAVVGMNNSKCS